MMGGIELGRRSVFLWNRGETYAELELRKSFLICSLVRHLFPTPPIQTERNQKGRKNRRAY